MTTHINAIYQSVRLFLWSERRNSILGVAALKFGATALGMISVIVAARALGTAGYGQVAYVMSWLQLLAIPFTAGLSPLLVRQISRYSKQNDPSLTKSFLSWSGRIAFGGGALLCAAMLLWAGAAWASSNFTEKIQLFLLGAPMLMLWPATTRVAGVLQGFGRVVLAQTFDWLINPLIYLIFLAFLWSLDLISPASVLLAAGFALAVAWAIGQLTLQAKMPQEVSKSTPQPRSPEKPRWHSSWRTFIVLQGVFGANASVPVLVLGALSADSEVGLFRTAESMATLLSLPLIVTNFVIAPEISRLFSQENTSEIRSISRAAALLSTSLVLPASLILILFGEKILGTIYGTQFALSHLPMTILCFGQIVNVLTGPVGLVLNMTGNEKVCARVMLYSLILNALLCAALSRPYGAVGAALGATFSLTLWNLLLFSEVRKRIPAHLAPEQT